MRTQSKKEICRHNNSQARCDEILYSKTSLKKHRKRMHKSVEEKNENVPESIGKENALKTLKVNQYHQVKCGICVIDFESIEEMDEHMDIEHGGRWKLGDPDVVFEGDSYEESSESEYSSVDEVSDMKESSESQSGEDWLLLVI